MATFLIKIEIACLENMHPNDLPPELLSEVFLRVPANDLVRCTLVCKSWLSIVKSLDFQTAHLKHLKEIRAKDNLLLIGEQFSYLVSDVTFAEVERIYHGFHIRYGTDVFLGSCNGLVCLAVRLDSSWDVVLWNPAIRKCKVIDSLPDQWGGGSWFNAGADYALGWHEIHNDLRVVKIYSWSYIVKISIYSLKTGMWNSYVGEDVPNIVFAWSHCFAKGSIHWITLVNVMDELFYRIETFNLVAESFKEMSLPEQSRDAADLYDNGSLVELRGSLAFVSFWIPEYELGNNYVVNIWLMQDYGVESSWTKVFTMEINGTVERPMGFTDPEKLICFHRMAVGDIAIFGVFNLATRQLLVMEGVVLSGAMLNYVDTILLL